MLNYFVKYPGNLKHLIIHNISTLKQPRNHTKYLGVKYIENRRIPIFTYVTKMNAL